MLYWINNDCPVNAIPKTRKQFFETGKNRLSESELGELTDYINRIVDGRPEAKAGEVTFLVPAFEASNDWNDSALQIIYEKVYPKDRVLSALWYGILCYQVMIERDDDWYCTKSDFRGMSNDLMVYWKRAS